ncbi:MAG: dipeptide epimerase [Bacteroidales bacterium]|nr:dipeptide epimerase [Bacteroidales bacterium]
MTTNRRDFLKIAGLTMGLSLIDTKSAAAPLLKCLGSKTGQKMKLSFQPYNLILKHVFTVASNSRATTPVVLTQIEYDGIIGYGEASMPPYLGESQESVTKFLSKVDLSPFNDPFQLDEILGYIDSIDEKNTAAKASIDIALHDLTGKILNQPMYKIWGLSKENTPNTSFTIGIDAPEIIREKTLEAGDQFKILKVKLGRNNDKEIIETIRSVTDIPLCVDVNQGWTDKQMALDMIYWLKEKNVIFVEQPMKKENPDDMAWLTQHSPLPTIADEALQRLPDVKRVHQVYSGINVKLMKCGGMREAHKMIELARALDMKVMIGCMTETSCAVSAAAQLSPLTDWADLDGNLLIKNDVYDGVKIINGKVTLNDRPGIGIKKLR